MDPARPTRSAEELDRDRFAHRLGGVCAVLGGVGFLFVVSVAHGDPPDEPVRAALRYVADSPHWTATHLAGIVCVLLWVAAFSALVQPLRSGAGYFMGRLALGSMMIGAAVFALDFTIDGYAFKQVADDWAAASGPEAATQLQLGAALWAAGEGGATAWATWTLGLPFLLLGLALLAGSAYPRLLVWAVTVTGAITLGGGVAIYLEIEAGFVVALFANTISCLWLIVLGVLMLREGWRAPQR